MSTPPAIEQIAQDHDAMLRRIASTYEADRYLAEELVQDMYLAIWRALPGFRAASSLRTFVARIATNRAITHVARASRSPRLLELSEHLPASGETPEGQAMVVERGARLMAAVRLLPLAYRQAVLLTLEGLAPGEISNVLGISTNAVAIRLTRGKALLRELTGDMT
jgi:RNA polymerase sigma factor (sigma-70 family)